MSNETFCANAAIREDKFNDALDLLQPALEKSPGSVFLLSAAALAHFRLGRYDHVEPRLRAQFPVAQETPQAAPLPPNADGSTDQVHQFGCQFGKINNVQTDPRAMQFALKFTF